DFTAWSKVLPNVSTPLRTPVYDEGGECSQSPGKDPNPNRLCSLREIYARIAGAGIKSLDSDGTPAVVK
ncbi:hypothetical protein BgiMline_011838, partial [Biomphalaria glabrata]